MYKLPPIIENLDESLEDNLDKSLESLEDNLDESKFIGVANNTILSVLQNSSASLPSNLSTTSFPVNLNTTSFPVNLNTTSFPVNLSTTSFPVNLKIHKLYDNIHGEIVISTHALQITKHTWFQRLKDIKQLGTLYFKFPYANHTVYDHSI